MIGLGQASWFLDQLSFWFPNFDRSASYDAVNGLSDIRYQELKKLFYKGFADGGGKEKDPAAQFQLKTELIKLGAKFNE